ncbi:hypothetical protein [Streptomyces hydrogenans]
MNSTDTRPPYALTPAQRAIVQRAAWGLLRVDYASYAPGTESDLVRAYSREVNVRITGIKGERRGAVRRDSVEKLIREGILSRPFRASVVRVTEAGRAALEGRPAPEPVAVPEPAPVKVETAPEPTPEPVKTAAQWNGLPERKEEQTSGHEPRRKPFESDDVREAYTSEDGGLSFSLFRIPDDCTSPEIRANREKARTAMLKNVAKRDKGKPEWKSFGKGQLKLKSRTAPKQTKTPADVLLAWSGEVIHEYACDYCGEFECTCVRDTVSAVLANNGGPVVDAEGVARGREQISGQTENTVRHECADQIAMGEGVPESPEIAEPDFPVTLAAGESAVPYEGEHHRAESDGRDWSFSTEAGHGYRLWEKNHARGTWFVGHGVDTPNSFWWAESEDGDAEDLAAAVAWCRKDSASRAWAARVWETHGHINGERVAWSAETVMTELEPNAWSIERFGRVGLAGKFGWGWEIHAGGSLAEAGSGGNVDGAFRKRAVHRLTVAGLEEVPTDRLVITGTDALHGKDAAAECGHAWEYAALVGGACWNKKAPGRYLVDVLAEDGSVMGRIGLCAFHLGKRLAAVHGHQGNPWETAYERAGKVGGHMGTRTDWEERFFELTAELVTAALEAGESNPRPDAVAVLYAEAEELRTKQEEKAARAAKTISKGGETVGRGSMAPKRKAADPKVSDITFSEKTSFPCVAELLGHHYVVRQEGKGYSVQHEHSAAKLEVTPNAKGVRALPMAKRAILADAVARGQAQPDAEEQPEPEDPYGPYEPGQMVTVDGVEGVWCLMAEGHGVWQAEPTTLNGGERREFKASELFPWGAVEALAGYHALNLYKEETTASAFMLPVDAKGRTIKPGMLVVQHYFEQSHPRRVRRVYSNGNWSAEAVSERDGSVLSENCNNLQIVTQEQVDALAEPLRVEAGAHRGWIVQALVTRHAGQFRATCTCHDGLELIEPGRSRAVRWFKTQAEAVAAWHEHAAEPVTEPEACAALIQQARADGGNADAGGLWWASCRGGDVCPDESETGHVIAPAGYTSFRETREDAVALVVWHESGEDGQAPVDRGGAYAALPETIAVRWTSYAYNHHFETTCAQCSHVEQFTGPLGSSKTAVQRREEVRDVAITWALEHHDEHERAEWMTAASQARADEREDAADTEEPEQEKAEVPAGEPAPVQEQDFEPADTESAPEWSYENERNPRPGCGSFPNPCNHAWPCGRDAVAWRTVQVKERAEAAAVTPGAELTEGESVTYAGASDDGYGHHFERMAYDWQIAEGRFRTKSNDLGDEHRCHGESPKGDNGWTISVRCLHETCKGKVFTSVAYDAEALLAMRIHERKKHPQEQPAATVAPKAGEPGFMAALLEKHVGPDWKPIEATADPEFADEPEEQPAPVQGLAQISRKQRRAAWRIAAGEPAPVTEEQPVVELPAVPLMLDAAPVRAELEAGQRTPIAVPYQAPARTFATPYLPDTGRATWEPGQRVTLDHRAGTTRYSTFDGVRVVWDDAPNGTDYVNPRVLWAEGSEPQPYVVPDFYADDDYLIAAPEPKPYERPSFYDLPDFELAPPVVVEHQEQHDELAELRAELEELRRDVETWGAEVAALAVDTAEDVVRQAYEELHEMRAAELSVMLRQAQTVREELLADVAWEPVPAKVKPLRGMWASVASLAAVAAAGWREGWELGING